MIGLGIVFLIGLGVASRVGGDAVGIYVAAWILMGCIGAGVSAGQDRPHE